MRRLVLSISCGRLLVGCQLYWTKPGATLADFTAAHQACLRPVGTPLPDDPDNGLVNPESYKTCLKANGWAAEPAGLCRDGSILDALGPARLDARAGPVGAEKLGWRGTNS